MVGRPWLVVIRDAPMPPPRAASYRLWALRSRVLGIAEVPYLYDLRAVDTPAAVLGNRQFVKAAAALRGQLGIKK
jgi:hypothetical protein